MTATLTKTDLSDLLGIPYEYGKTDCYWLANEIYKRHTLFLPDRNSFDHLPFLERIKQMGIKISQPRDLAICVLGHEILGTVVYENNRFWVYYISPKNVSTKHPLDRLIKWVSCDLYYPTKYYYAVNWG